MLREKHFSQFPASLRGAAVNSLYVFWKMWFDPGYFLFKSIGNIKICLTIANAFGNIGCGMPDQVDFHNNEKRMR